ncbi:MAG: trehalose-phosphatase [Myxococcales bacterium]|nr:trehalose-phosphatase [Myxococcales bacterium]
MDSESRRLQALIDRITALPPPLLLTFDVDGTLAPIVDDPASARVPEPTARALRKLARRPELRVALLTGRDAHALARMVRVAGAYRALEHGRLLLRPGQRARVPALAQEARDRLRGFEDWALRTALPVGAKLEHKASSRALHVRTLQTRKPAQAAALLRQAAAQARRLGLHPRPGRAVLEAELEPANKGDALEALYKASGARSVVFAGDDLTDRPAIARAVRLGGLGLFVRSPERPRAPAGCTASLVDQGQLAALVGGLAERFGLS